MRLCKRETGLYWFVHSVVWIGITLPTVFFLLRINHPRHDETKTKSIKLNKTKDDNETLTPVYKTCINYSRDICGSVEKKNSSENALHNNDNEIKTILNAVSFSKNSSTCKSSLENTLCIKKYLSCGNISVETNKFCKTCFNDSQIKSNTLLERVMYNWLKNLSCISQLLEEKDKSSTSETNFSSCSYPLVKDENNTCRIPCDWSLMSPRLRDIYYVVMIINFWAALITTVITLATLASFRKMREFPHIVRFYILICSAMYATSSLLPLCIGLAKVYCGEERFWNEDGHSTTPTIIEGVISHYFFLAFCFWSLCYVINAYSVIIKRAHKVFDKKRKYHLIQFSICSTLPALLVAVNMAVNKPGYKSVFLDRMTSVFTSPVLEYVTFTLPVQIAIGISVSLLWSIIRFVRKVRQNKTTLQSVRPDEDIKGFVNAERQFIKLAVLFIVTVAVVLSSEVVITYRNEEYLHKVHEYFHCLKPSNGSCPKPEVRIFFLSSVKICGPGIYCLLNFFLLFFNKDTRAVWRKWLDNILLCKRTEKDEKPSSGPSVVLPTNNNRTRPRSCTLDTNASLNSLHKLSTYSTRLETLRSNEDSTSIAGSISPKEDSPLQINGNTS